MSEAAQAFPAHTLSFDLTDDEARIIAARAGFRRTLRRGFSTRHVAPLVAFMLLLAFAAILALTGLIARRVAEAAILLAAMAFMANRLAAHWRMRRAQTPPPVTRGAAPTLVTMDASGLSVQTPAGARRIEFPACREAEVTGALIYLWTEKDEPTVIPTRAFASEADADRFVATLRGAIARAARSG